MQDKGKRVRNDKERSVVCCNHSSFTGTITFDISFYCVK